MAVASVDNSTSLPSALGTVSFITSSGCMRVAASAWMVTRCMYPLFGKSVELTEPSAVDNVVAMSPILTFCA
ncbi:hypothetical protein D3C72_1329460 [compost metagenome]